MSKIEQHNATLTPKHNILCAHTDIWPIEKLTPHPENTNSHPEEQVALLAKIIDYQGQRVPIKVSKQSGYITAGHCRLSALKRLGWTHVAVDYQAYEDKAQEIADLNADNKVAELAKFDQAGMIASIRELNLEAGFDLELFGVPELELVEPEVVGMPDLPNGEKSDLEQITFTLTAEQASEIKQALKQSKDQGPFEGTGNDNSNGNALSRICSWYLHG